MAMKLSEVQARTKVVSVEWDDETVDVSYSPNRMTPEVLDKASDAEDKGNLDVLGDLLEPVLEWWDVLDDEDKRLPTDAATIKRMPLSFVMAVLAAVQEDQRPPESKG